LPETPVTEETVRNPQEGSTQLRVTKLGSEDIRVLKPKGCHWNPTGKFMQVDKAYFTLLGLKVVISLE
jgi:hypothetical protein